MLPALLKFSSAAKLLDKFPEEDRNLHAGDQRADVMANLAEDRAQAWAVMEEDDTEFDAFEFGNSGTVDAALLDALPL